MGGKVQGLRSTNWEVQNRQVGVKNSIGNGEGKELICMTHRHELRGGGDCWWEGGVPGGGVQRGKNWDNCNSIINKIYLKKRKKIKVTTDNTFKNCM